MFSFVFLLFRFGINFIIIPFWNFVKCFSGYNSKKELNGQGIMKIRKQEDGNANIIGKNVERLRKEKGIKQKDFIAKMQVLGCDINPTSYSKLEGQLRSATDKEVYIIAKILDMPMEALFKA